MCNRYENYLNKMNLFYKVYGYEPFSETRLKLVSGSVKEDIFPKYPALVFRGEGETGVLEVMKWGFPPPPKGRAPVTNVRNTQSPFWRPWLKTEWRCLAPATSFSEFSYAPPKGNRWFGLASGDPFFFAGICRPYDWSATPGDEPHRSDAMVFSFLTCEPNDVVRPWHEKAMPVILSNPTDAETWLNAPTDIALELQRPLPSKELVLLDKAA